MKFQQPKNDPINSSEEGRLELKNEIISTWLGRRDLFQLFDSESKIDIQEIRELIDEEMSLL